MRFLHFFKNQEKIFIARKGSMYFKVFTENASEDLRGKANQVG